MAQKVIKELKSFFSFDLKITLFSDFDPETYLITYCLSFSDEQNLIREKKFKDFESACIEFNNLVRFFL